MLRPRNRPFHNLLIPPSKKGETVLVFDQFTDTESKALSSHAIAPINTLSVSWTIENSLKIYSNQTGLLSAANGFGYFDAGISDLVISAKVKSTATSDNNSYFVGPVGRFLNNANFFRVCIQAYRDLFRIYETAGGSSATRAQASVSLDASTFYTVRAVFDGQKISATLDGAYPISYDLATFNETETKHGFFLRAATDRLDDFKILSL